MHTHHAWHDGHNATVRVSPDGRITVTLAGGVIDLSGRAASLLLADAPADPHPGVTVTSTGASFWVDGRELEVDEAHELIARAVSAAAHAAALRASA